MFIRCDSVADGLGDSSPMFTNSSAKHRRCYGDDFVCCVFDFITEEKVISSSCMISFAATRYVVPRGISPSFICSPSGTIPSHMASSRHHHDIVKTSPLRPRCIPNIRRSHAEGSPTIAISKSTSLTVSR